LPTLDTPSCLSYWKLATVNTLKSEFSFLNSTRFFRNVYPIYFWDLRSSDMLCRVDR
jgi:hypothetical protein